MSSASADDTPAAQDRISTINSLVRAHLTMPQRRDVVWSTLRDIRQWYAEYTFEVVSGPSYERAMGLAEGQIIHATSSHPFPRIDGRPDSPPEKVVARVLEVDEPNRIVVMLSGQAVYDYARLTSFYILSVDESNDGTTVTVENLGEAELQTPLSPAKHAEYKQALTANWQRSWTTALESLRRQLDEEATR
jgi:hypothetical protein